MKKPFIFIGSLLFLFSCVDKDISQSPQFISQAGFSQIHKRITINNTDHSVLIADTGRLRIFRNYELTFREHYVINNNLLQITTSNTLVAERQIPYIEISGYFQKLFLLKIDESDFDENPRFIYYSLKYNPDNKLIAIGKMYLGRLDKLHYKERKCTYRISFKEEMKFSGEKKGNRPAEYKLKKVETPMIFYVDSLDYKPDSSILVNTIILTGANKIGGTKYLTYPVQELMGNKEALKFINQPKK